MTMVRSTILAVVALVVATSPAGAARTLISYASLDGTSAAFIHDGSSAGFADYPVLTCNLAAATGQCRLDGYSDGSLTDFGISAPGAVSARAVFAGPAIGTTATYSTGISRLATRILADSDIVYSYADTSGRNAVMVSSGYLIDFTITSTVNCQVGGVFCTSALVDPDSLQGGYVVAPRSGNTIRSVVAFPGVNGDVPGFYTAASRDVTAQLRIVGPVATVGFVPEPTTWAMMVLGLGIVGAAMRRRRIAILAA